MAGMGLENAAAGTAGFEGLRSWLADALKMRAIQQAEQDRITGAERQRVLDTRAGETHALNMRRGEQTMRLDDAQEGRASTEFGQEQGDRTSSAARVREIHAQIDAMPDLTPMQRFGLKIEATQGRIPDALLKGPEVAKPDYVMAPNGRLIDKNDPNNLNQNFAAPREPRQAAAAEPLVAIKDPVTGQPVLVPRSQAAGKAPASTRDQAMTEGQSNAAGFADRMKFNETHIRKFDNEATSRWNQIKGAVAPTEMLSDANQSYVTAKKNWIAATLRKESGAAISESEYTEGNLQYFPQPGESPAIVQQKRQLRAITEAAMRRSSGHAANMGQAGGDPDDLGAEW